MGENLIYTVEDEESIREVIRCTLNSAGFEAVCFSNAEDFWKEIQHTKPKLILLDIMLPDQSGTDIIKGLKKDSEYKNIPVIFLTAKTSEIDKVTGLDYGADDYIAKPFGVLELIARVKAVLRRSEQPAAKISQQHTYKDLVIDASSKEIFKNGESIKLTYKEYKLFLYLYDNMGVVLSRNNLLETIWGYDFEGETRTVDAHIKSLRNKLADQADAPQYIATIRGHGYKSLKP